LLREYDSLKNIYDHLDALPPKVAEKLAQNKPSALLSQNLAQIHLNVPFEFNLEEASNWQINSPDALALLRNEFGFKTIPARIEKLSKKLSSKNQTSLF